MPRDATSPQTRSTTCRGERGSPKTSIVFCLPAGLMTSPCETSFPRRASSRARPPGVERSMRTQGAAGSGIGCGCDRRGGAGGGPAALRGNVRRGRTSGAPAKDTPQRILPAGGLRRRSGSRCPGHGRPRELPVEKVTRDLFPLEAPAKTEGFSAVSAAASSGGHSIHGPLASGGPPPSPAPGHGRPRTGRSSWCRWPPPRRRRSAP